MTADAIRVRGLRKSYGSQEALGGIDFDVSVGQVFAMLGPNGAGKTTTVEILEGHRERSAGEVSVLGFDPARGGSKYRERIGIVLQAIGVQPYLTVAETLDLYRGYYPRPRSREDLLELVGLADRAGDLVSRLSGGLRRRLDVAVGLAGDPDLLFLDEPTTGFDPSARRGAWAMVKELSRLGKTIFLTTHYLDEAQALADRVAVVVGGRIVADGPPDSLGSGPGTTTIRFALPPGAPSLPGRFGATQTADRYAVTSSNPTLTLHDLTGWAVDAGVTLERLDVSRPSLEDVYLELTWDAE